MNWGIAILLGLVVLNGWITILLLTDIIGRIANFMLSNSFDIADDKPGWVYRNKEK